MARKRTLLRRLLPHRWFRKGPPVVTVLRLQGVIMQGRRSDFSQPGLNLESLEKDLEQAFTFPDLRAVALIVNSPGGSPVQSALIYSRIRELAEEHKVQVLVFAEDVAASGGYWLAVAGDEIYADESSLIGSIGVITAGFGFVGLMRKLGVQRRVHTQGEKKMLLDPFQPEKSEDVKRLTTIQKELHAAFQEVVRTRRGKKLKEPEKKIFSGDIWTGGMALKAGLIDGVGHLRPVLKEKFGKKVRIIPIERRRGLLSLFAGARGNNNPAQWADDMLSAMEERAQWERFGL